MGEVYEVDDLESGRRLALKVLTHALDSPEARRRFLREGRLAASINHPNSVYIFGTEEIEGTPVIAMELVRGGTLKDQVKRSGPLGAGEAVDAILQVVTGLSAAQTNGVLHRDVKPSNCFVDDDRVVKVGDFGLSVSTLARGDASLTLSGAVVGTPAFSAPEQLRGEELDVRADIYSVGMTLYYLLTGRPAFEGENMVKLLAAVLEQAPPSPAAFRREISRELAQVVLRCLAKRPSDRFGGYEELRQALMPLSSTAPAPAGLAARFLAGVVDFLLAGVLTFVLTLPLAPYFVEWTDAARFSSSKFLPFSIGSFLLSCLYFGVPEGLWGASMGKALFRLRVVNIRREVPGLPAALWRAFVFWLLPDGFYLVAFMIDARSAITGVPGFLVFLGSFGFFAALFTTARRRNGFAAVHDLLSRTRVIQKAGYGVRPTCQVPPEPAPDLVGRARLGPYFVLGPLQATEAGAPPGQARPSVGSSLSDASSGSAGGEELLSGYDAQLQRRVWLRRLSPEAVAHQPAPVMLSRAGRLRWLSGVRAPGENWDAYDAPSGKPLLNLVHQPQPWSAVRYWLADLADELSAGTKDHSLPATLGLDRVWITADGRAKLLDFPAPGAHPRAVTSTETEARVSAASTFLRQVALAALEGRCLTPDEARAAEPRRPLPLHARAFVQELAGSRATEEVIRRLEPLLHKGTAISSRRRLLLAAACGLPWLAFVGLFAFVATALLPWVAERRPHLFGLDAQVERLTHLQRTNAPPDSPAGKERRALEVFIGAEWRDLLADPLLAGVTARFSPEQRKLADELARAVGNASEDDLSEARTLLKPQLDRSRLEVPRVRSRDFVEGYALGICLWWWFFVVALPSLVAALVCHGGLLLHLFGLAVVTHAGRPASRLRCLWRGFVAWLPIMAVVWLDHNGSRLVLGLFVPFWVTFVLLGVQLAGAVDAVLRPESGLQDRLAGTCLVRR